MVRKNLKAHSISLLWVVGLVVAGVLAGTSVGIPSASAADSSISLKSGLPWEISQPTRLQPVSVQLENGAWNPTYTVTLSNGEKIRLDSTNPPAQGLTSTELAEVAEDSRIILESVLRLIETRPTASMAVVNSDYVVEGVINAKWLEQNGLKTFDPATTLEPSTPSFEAKPTIETVAESKSRLQRVLSFFKNAIYTSTIIAYRNWRLNAKDLSSRVTEWGVQIALRGDLQLGMGSINVTRNFPLMLSLGYNRTTRTVVFRRGYRTEKMSGGTALVMGPRVEFRRYRMVADEAFAADPRQHYARVQGTSWYPPSVPIFSPVADFGPGFQSEGFALGFNFVNLFLPATLAVDAAFAAANTTTGFVEKQRIYAIAVPDGARLMERLQRRLDTSMQFFGDANSSLGLRCSHLFLPSARTADIRSAR